MAETAPCTALVGPPPTWTVQCVGSDDALRELWPAWDELLVEMDRPSPFLSSVWVDTWWRHFGTGSHLWVLVVRDQQNRVAGIAPLYIARRRSSAGLALRSLEFLGYRGSAPCADHLDFLARREGRAEIVAALLTELFRLSAQWDRVCLADLASDSLLPSAWAEAATAAGAQSERLDAAICYYRALPASADALRQQIKLQHPKLASNLKYYRKRLEQAHRVRFDLVSPGPEIAKTLVDLARLHALAHQRKGESGNFALTDYRAFHGELVERLAACGKLYLARIICDDAVVAVFYGYFEAGVLYFYQSGYDTAYNSLGVGTLMLGWVLEDAAERLRAHEFDFLRGGESYKSRWASGIRQTVTLLGWSGGYRSFCDRCGRSASRYLNRLRPAARWLRRRIRYFAAARTDA